MGSPTRPNSAAVRWTSRPGWRGCFCVEPSVNRSRTYRDALRHELDEERVDRIIVSATTDPRTGLDGEDLQWLLEKVPAEVLILRADFDDRATVTAEPG